jgi:hypothetical protein
MVSGRVGWFQKNRIGHEEAAMIEAGTQSRLGKNGKDEVALRAEQRDDGVAAQPKTRNPMRKAPIAGPQPPLQGLQAAIDRLAPGLARKDQDSSGFQSALGIQVSLRHLES